MTAHDRATASQHCPELVHKTMRVIAPQQSRNVLCISGFDPSGGAGITADIESCHALGVHPLGALTALTVQDTRDVHAIEALSADWLDAQIQRLADDAHIDAVKCGVFGSAEQVDVVVDWLARLGVPSVLDPVLRAGGGTELAAQPVALALRERLAPKVTVITPNAAEARLLTGCADLADAAAALGALGCEHVLVTGGDEIETTDSTDYHWHAGTLRRLQRERLAMSYHGAGCTLAATLAARLALGDTPTAAIDTATALVHDWLCHPKAIGGGRPSPARTPVAP